MAIQVTPNLTDVSMCEDTTGWTAVGGTNAQNDNTVFDAIQGSRCLQNYNASTIARGADFTYGTDQVLTDKNIYMWFATSRTGAFQVKGANGMRIRIEDSSARWAEWDIFGSDTLPHGGWICWSVLVSSTTASRTGGTFPTLTAIRKIGWRAASIAGKTYIYWDAIRFGTGLTITSGASDAITIENIYSVDNSSTFKYGVISKINGVYVVQGKLIFGDAVGTGSIDFSDNSQVIIFPQNEYYLDETNEIRIVGNATGTTNFNLVGSFIKSNQRRFIFDADDTNIDQLDIDGCSFVGADNIYFKNGENILNCVFDNCLQIFPGTSVFQNNIIKNSVDTLGSILFPSDDTNIKHLTFVNNNLGVEYRSSSDNTSPKFDDFNFDNVSGKYDVNNTSGGAVSISLINTPEGMANSYTGSAVTFTSNPVITKITVRDIDDNSLIEGARVFLEASDNSGDLNYMESVTLSRSGTTVTVAHSAHGLITGAMVHIRGANQIEYNGTFEITYIGDNSYSYEISTTPDSPATGTITSTTVIFNTLTNSSGYVTDTRVLSTAQPVTGRARLSTGGTLYKTQPITATINATSGLDMTVFLIKDA